MISKVNIACNHDATRYNALAIGTGTQYLLVTPDTLAKKWLIGLETAKNTFKVTTQNGLRQAIHPLQRQY